MACWWYSVDEEISIKIIPSSFPFCVKTTDHVGPDAFVRASPGGAAEVWGSLRSLDGPGGPSLRDSWRLKENQGPGENVEEWLFRAT
jgi:hypothetical protein